MSDDFAFEGSISQPHNTFTSGFPQVVWASMNPTTRGQQYNGWRIEVGKCEDLDESLHNIGWPTIELLHGGGKRKVTHWDMSGSGEFFIVATRMPTSAEMRRIPDRFGVAYGYSPNRKDGKILGSKLEAVTFYLPWVLHGIFQPLVITTSRRFCMNPVNDGKNVTFSGSLVALGDHSRALAAVQELRKAKAEREGKSEPRPAPFYAVAASLVPGTIEPMGSAQGGESSLGMSIVSGHPAVFDRDYLLPLYLLNFSLFPNFRHLKDIIEGMIPGAIQWSIDRSRQIELSGE